MKGKHGKTAMFFAGGTDLLLEWQDGKVDLEYCIDLSFISDLAYIEYTREQVRIGSLAKVTSVEGSSVIKTLIPVLSEAASQMASPQIRNLATIGGNLCHAAPSADLAPPLLALGAEVKVLSVLGERCIALEDLFLGVNKTALNENELLTEINVLIPPPRTATSFLKLTRTSIDIALVNTAVRISVDDRGTFTDVKIVLGAVAPTPFRSKAAERLLLGVNIAKLNKDLLEEVSWRAAADSQPITDVRASAGYRRETSKVLVNRAIEDIIQKLGGQIV